MCTMNIDTTSASDKAMKAEMHRGEIENLYNCKKFKTKNTRKSLCTYSSAASRINLHK